MSRHPSSESIMDTHTHTDVLHSSSTRIPNTAIDSMNTSHTAITGFSSSQPTRTPTLACIHLSMDSRAFDSSSFTVPSLRSITSQSSQPCECEPYEYKGQGQETRTDSTMDCGPIHR